MKMEQEIEKWIQYLEKTKQISENTKQSYQRDLKKMMNYFQEMGINQWVEITSTNLTSYLLYMEREGFATASVSRKVASLKNLFQYLWKCGVIKENPAESLKAPKVERKAPMILSQEEAALVLQQPNGNSPKEIRDRAMLEILYRTGIRVSELVALKVTDLNLELKYFICRGKNGERAITLEKIVFDALTQYLEYARNQIVKEETDLLFLNCKGNSMSRQGFWKIMKQYVKQANIEKEITPQMIRCSFALHLLENGMEFPVVQKNFKTVDLTAVENYVQQKQ